MTAAADSRADAADYYDPEKNATGDHYCFSETTPTYVRHEFVKKVFTIVGIQLSFTFGFLALALNVETVHDFFFVNTWVGFASVIVFFILSLVVSFKRSLAHNKKVAGVIVGIMTVCMSLYVTCFAVHFSIFEVLVAAGITAGLTIAIAIFACQTKYDFTGIITYLLCISIGMILAGILVAIFPSRALRIGYSAAFAVFLCIYLVVDIQLAIGGKRYEWTIDDYVIAAVAIYSDIVTLFLHILSIIGNVSN